MLLPYLNENLIEAGCDEAGRGCLAGAVYAAAVILPKDFKNELLNDSKQLTEKQRYALREVIEKEDRKSTRLNYSHSSRSRMPSSA